jgi:hypothetical protein
MKASELRIGNYVYDTLGKVNIIDLEAITYIVKEPHNQVKPIPLTEEWLLKLGFKNNRLGLFDVVKVVDDIAYHIYFIKKHLKEIQYVHQLQNLYFALTGEELTIKQQEQ